MSTICFQTAKTSAYLMNNVALMLQKEFDDIARRFMHPETPLDERAQLKETAKLVVLMQSMMNLYPGTTSDFHLGENMRKMMSEIHDDLIGTLNTTRSQTPLHAFTAAANEYGSLDEYYLDVISKVSDFSYLEHDEKELFFGSEYEDHWTHITEVAKNYGEEIMQMASELAILHRNQLTKIKPSGLQI